MDKDKVLREHLIKLLAGDEAHVGFDKVVKNFPKELTGRKVKGSPHTAWQELEHMRIAQWDILEFSVDPAHVSPKWPDEYWPAAGKPPDDRAWDLSVKRFRKDLKRMQKLVQDPSTDLYSPIPHGTGQTILREALLVADHNAYHLGQLMLIRRMLE
jgi:hypothetical protein